MRDSVLVDEPSQYRIECCFVWVAFVVLQELFVVDLEPFEERFCEVSGVVVRRCLGIKVLGVSGKEVHLRVVVELLQLQFIDGLGAHSFFSLD